MKLSQKTRNASIPPYHRFSSCSQAFIRPSTHMYRVSRVEYPQYLHDDLSCVLSVRTLRSGGLPGSASLVFGEEDLNRQGAGLQTLQQTTRGKTVALDQSVKYESMDYNDEFQKFSGVRTQGSWRISSTWWYIARCRVPRLLPSGGGRTQEQWNKWSSPCVPLRAPRILKPFYFHIFTTCFIRFFMLI